MLHLDSIVKTFYLSYTLYINDIAETTVIIQGSYIRYFVPSTAEPLHVSVKQGQKITAVEV
jgi:hypothetical protein